jgi:hypothetical protein
MPPSDEGRPLLVVSPTAASSSPSRRCGGSGRKGGGEPLGDVSQPGKKHELHTPTAAASGYSVFFVPPAIVFAIATGCVFIWREFAFSAGGIAVVVIGAILALLCLGATPLLNKWFLVVTLRRFADEIHSEAFVAASAVAEGDVELARPMCHSVGFKRVPGNRDTARPNAVLFYPTDAHDLVKADHPWLPHNDFAYAAGLATQEDFPAFLATSMGHCTVAAAQDAPLAATLTADALAATPEHPLIHFAHGDSMHEQGYFCLIADMVAAGAVVYSVNSTDGSAGHALEPESIPDEAEDARRVCSGACGPSGALPRSCDKDTSAEDLVAAPDADPDDIVKHRRRHYTRRVPEVVAAVEFLAKGGAHRALGLDARSNVLVNLVGHSSGGGVSVAALGELLALDAGMPNTAKLATWNASADEVPLIDLIRACVLFDLGPSYGRFSALVVKPDPRSPDGTRRLRDRLPPTLSVLSQQWYSDERSNFEPVHAAFNGTADLQKAEAPAAAAKLKEVRCPHTDHTTVTDVGQMLRLPGIRHSCVKAGGPEDRRQIARWARDTLAFLRDHAQGEWQTA